jgi:hypothetical protein
LALAGILAGYRHTIFYYAARLPGQDDILVARAPLAKFVVVRNPDIARHVLVSNQDNYAKSAEYDLLAVAFGRGLVTDLDDELWQRNRRLVQPVFAKRNVDTLAPQMTAAAVAAAKRWQAHAGPTASWPSKCASTSLGCSPFSVTGSSAAGRGRCAGLPIGCGRRGWPSTHYAGKQRYSRRARYVACGASSVSSTS